MTTIENVVSSEQDRLQERGYQANGQEDLLLLQLREEWVFFMEVWKQLLATNPSPVKIFQMRTDYRKKRELVF